MDEIVVIENFQTGQRVRIKPDAFPGSTDRRDVRSRGTVGTLTFLLDDNGEGKEALWEWRGDNGAVCCPLSSELEAV
jgi:hypothetical protein